MAGGWSGRTRCEHYNRHFTGTATTCCCCAPVLRTCAHPGYTSGGAALPHQPAARTREPHTCGMWRPAFVCLADHDMHELALAFVAW